MKILSTITGIVMIFVAAAAGFAQTPRAGQQPSQSPATACEMK